MFLDPGLDEYYFSAEATGSIGIRVSLVCQNRQNHKIMGKEFCHLGKADKRIYHVSGFHRTHKNIRVSKSPEAKNTQEFGIS